MKVYNKILLNEYYQSLTYDDISLIPTEVSRMKSRKEVDTSSNFLGIKLSLPIISSPMETVTGIEMAKELGSLGCLGIVNRFDSSLNEILNDKHNGRKISAISVALNTPLETIKRLSEGRKIIYRLAEKSDILFEQFRPAVMSSLGLGYDDLKKMGKTLITELKT